MFTLVVSGLATQVPTSNVTISLVKCAHPVPCVFVPHRVESVATVNSPQDVVFHPATGDLYFTSSNDHVIKCLSNSTGEVSWSDALFIQRWPRVRIGVGHYSIHTHIYIYIYIYINIFKILIYIYQYIHIYICLKF